MRSPAMPQRWCDPCSSASVRDADAVHGAGATRGARNAGRAGSIPVRPMARSLDGPTGIAR